MYKDLISVEWQDVVYIYYSIYLFIDTQRQKQNKKLEFDLKISLLYIEDDALRFIFRFVNHYSIDFHQ